MQEKFPKPNDFVKAYINSYSNDILVQKLILLYAISEEEAQQIIVNESIALDHFLNPELNYPSTIINSMEDGEVYEEEF